MEGLKRQLTEAPETEEGELGPGPQEDFQEGV
jgi:hypothetical protein